MVSPSAAKHVTSTAPEPARRRGPSPTSAVALEAVRALGAIALLPARTVGYALTRSALRAEVRLDLERAASLGQRIQLPPADALVHRPNRTVRLFIACAEASGEVHARSLLRSLSARLAELGQSAPLCHGIGGDALEAEGVRLLARPVDRASMGFKTPLAGLPYYMGVLRDCAAHFAAQPPDVVVAVDSPALNVPLGRIAHRFDLPVVHFIAPQYWGWAPWRARAYPGAVDRALTILPFEQAWFARRGIHVSHVGHPALDALAHVPVTRPSESARELVLLPGSRTSIIQRNLPWMLQAAARLRHNLGDVPVVIAHDDPAKEPLLYDAVERAGARTWVRVETGDLHRVLARGRAALTVSGTILIDLLHHRLPAVVVYRLGNRASAWIAPRMLTVPWFSSVNLLAAREVYPEFSFAGSGPPEIGPALERCYGDRAWREQCIRGLEQASDLLGPPGAADRAALEVLDVLGVPRALADSRGIDLAAGRGPIAGPRSRPT